MKTPNCDQKYNNSIEIGQLHDFIIGNAGYSDGSVCCYKAYHGFHLILSDNGNLTELIVTIFDKSLNVFSQVYFSKPINNSFLYNKRKVEHGVWSMESYGVWSMEYGRSMDYGVSILCTARMHTASQRNINAINCYCTSCYMSVSSSSSSSSMIVYRAVL